MSKWIIRTTNAAMYLNRTGWQYRRKIENKTNQINKDISREELLQNLLMNGYYSYLSYIVCLQELYLITLEPIGTSKPSEDFDLGACSWSKHYRVWQFSWNSGCLFSQQKSSTKVQKLYEFLYVISPQKKCNKLCFRS